MSKSLNIAIYIPYNIFKSGGVQEHVTQQAAILKKRGHTVTVITPRPRAQSKYKKAPVGFQFLGVSARIKAPHATSADVSMSLDIEAIDAVLDNNYDVIHVHEPLSPIAARQFLARAEGRALRVGTFHAALPGNALGKSLVSTYKSYAKGVLPFVDVITAVSPAAVGYIQNYTELPINYIPNGIDATTYKPKAVERDRNMILFIGRLEKRKGARQLIRAFSVLKQTKPLARLIICGDGPLRQSLENYVENLDLSDDVEFKGYIDDKTKLELLNTCSVYSSPALYGESFGIVLAEAMAMQAPIVCHPNDGYAWVMKDTGRLSLVDCKDPYGYADRLKLLMEDDVLRLVWQAWAKDYVKQFNYQKIVTAYEKLYKNYLL
jgi:phosphatidylinositol alpha-mannosyltransferase